MCVCDRRNVLNAPVPRALFSKQISDSGCEFPADGQNEIGVHDDKTGNTHNMSGTSMSFSFLRPLAGRHDVRFGTQIRFVTPSPPAYVPNFILRFFPPKKGFFYEILCVKLKF